LRSDTIADISNDFPPLIPTLEDFRPVRCIHRKLLPRRPGRDQGMEQFCTLYEPSTDLADPPTILILTPIITPGSSLPYYHPTVSHLAFRYISSTPPSLRIEAVRLPDTPTDLNSKLYRTSLSLLGTIHRYGWGAMTNYKKRVIHDRLVPRDVYQDLYLIMRERHKHLIDLWQESTDPLKHVYEVRPCLLSYC
jgi:tRNASer (uridine44-2'-O)-methyltransferase